MKTIVKGFLFTALLTVLASCQNNEHADAQQSITLSHNQAVISPEHAGALAFKEYVESHSDIVVDVYPASQLGSLREQVEATQLGVIDITMQPTAMVAPFVEDIKIIDLPYLFPTNTEEKYAVLDSEVGDEILDLLEEGGFEGLGYWPGGYKLITTSTREIHEPEDMMGLTIRTMESPIIIETYENWNANPIPVPYSEVYNALQLGIVDGQENPLQTVYLNNYHEIQDHIVETFHGTMTYAFIANHDWFNDLPEDVQELITEAEEAGRTEARTVLAENEQEYRDELNASNKNFYSLTEEQIEHFRQASLNVHEEQYNEPHQRELLNRVYEKIEEITN